MLNCKWIDSAFVSICSDHRIVKFTLMSSSKQIQIDSQFHANQQNIEDKYAKVMETAQIKNLDHTHRNNVSFQQAKGRVRLRIEEVTWNSKLIRLNRTHRACLHSYDRL